jgi:hypothetical protein
MPREASLLWLACILAHSSVVRGEDPEFSGPQPGEKLTPFKAQGVFDDLAGKEFDPVTDADGKPLALIFVHEITRPTAGVLRVVGDYAATLREKGVSAAVVFLSDDKTAMEDRLKNARGAMPKGTPLGISLDGAEGPGAYGLNRNMALTVLVGKEGKVTANFALLQPSVQADAPKIATALAEAAGVDPPSEKDLLALAGPMRPAASGEMPAELATMLRGIINRSNSADDVDAAVKKLEDYLKDNPAEKQRVGDIARRIIDAGNLKNYGTERAQEHLQRFAKEFGEAKKEQKPKRER